MASSLSTENTKSESTRRGGVPRVPREHGSPRSPQSRKNAKAARSTAMADLSALKAEAAGQWTLASDQKLQDALLDFSMRLRDKTKNLVSSLETLSNDVDSTDVRLRNTFNEFLMLGNTQFIENVSNCFVDVRGVWEIICVDLLSLLHLITLFALRTSRLELRDTRAELSGYSEMCFSCITRMSELFNFCTLLLSSIFS